MDVGGDIGPMTCLSHPQAQVITSRHVKPQVVVETRLENLICGKEDHGLWHGLTPSPAIRSRAAVIEPKVRHELKVIPPGVKSSLFLPLRLLLDPDIARLASRG